MIAGLREWQTGLAPVDRVLLLVKEKVDELLRAFPLLHGRATQEVSITSGSAAAISHGLGRAAQGRLITYQSADARVWDARAPDKTFVYLNASSTVRVRLWVY